MRPSRRRRRMLFLAAALILTAGALPLLGVSRADPPQGEKYALLVGVRQYDPNELRDLPYAEDDVTALADVLKKAGYKRVVLMTQAEGAKQARFLPLAANVRKTLQGILEDRAEGDTVLIAFAGHGVQYQGEDENYFCPMDAKLADKSTLVSLGEVYKALEKSEAGTRLLLADCCRNDPRSDQSRAVEKVNLESVTRPQKAQPPGGVAALFSCSAGEKAYESADLKHGVFFHFVVEGLKGKADLDKDGQVSFQELELYTERQVEDYVKDKFGDDVKQRPERVGKTRGLVSLVKLDAGERPDATTDARIGSRPPPMDCTGEKGVSAEDVRKSQEAWAKYLGRKVEEEDEIAPGVKMKFVLVPPGKFLMGSPNDEQDRSDNEVLHEVELTHPFYLGMFDVTRGQFRRFVEAAKYKTEAESDGKGGVGWDPDLLEGTTRDPKNTWRTPGISQTEDDPVVQVSWNDAVKCAEWLSGHVKDGLKYRLPTEAEWEYSCRAGRPSSQPFGIGDGTPQSAHRDANFRAGYPGRTQKRSDLNKTTPVGSYKANALGLYDMHGNVLQWCSDWNGDYPAGRVVDPSGPASGDYRVYRGGSWDDYFLRCRAACRQASTPDNRWYDLGFRLARVPSGLDK